MARECSQGVRSDTTCINLIMEADAARCGIALVRAVITRVHRRIRRIHACISRISFLSCLHDKAAI